MENNEILTRELIVPTQFLRFAVDKTTKTVTQTTFTLHGRKISLFEIMKKMLREQEQFGVIRAAENTEELTGDDLDQALIIRKTEFDDSSPDNEKRKLLTVLSTTTYKNMA